MLYAQHSLVKATLHELHDAILFFICPITNGKSFNIIVKNVTILSKDRKEIVYLIFVDYPSGFSLRMKCYNRK